MSTEESKTLASRWMEEVWQKASPIAMDELLAPDFSFNYPPPGVEPNRETYKQGVNSFHVGLPDIQFTTEAMVAEGNKVAVHWTGRGTHKGEFWGVAPTGKQVTMGGISIIRIEGGKIVEEWGYMDMMGLMQQLGPPPE
jgi:steroid delta-isomerase-like uncharacterized protein